MAKLPYSYPTLSAQASVDSLASEVSKTFQRTALAFNEPAYGGTGDRPTIDLVPAQQFYDTDINKPIWWDAIGLQWRDAMGAVV